MQRREFLRLGLVAAGGLLMGGLTRRLLLVAGGGGEGFTTPPTEPFTITAAPDGAWSWFGDPRAIRVGNYQYIGYVDTSGNVCLRWRNALTGEVGPEIVLHAALDYDDHANPSLTVLPNGKLAAWYCRHQPISTTPHQRISTNTLAADPELTGGFGSETDLDAQIGATSYDYPIPFVVGSRTYLFFRDIPGGSGGTSYELIRTHSDDNGATWSALTRITLNPTNSGRAYWKMIEAGGLVHIAYTDGSPNTDTTHLYHFAWDPSTDTYSETDGTAIAASLPLGPGDMTPVFTASNTWVWDIAVADGKPRILHPTWATEFSDHRYNRAQWTGSAWASAEICAGGAGIDATGVYSGGMCFNHDDPDRIYASRQVSGQWELFEERDDGGGSFSEEQITAGSSAKNIRPFVVDDELVVWLFGTYTGYSAAFNMGIQGLRPL